MFGRNPSAESIGRELRQRFPTSQYTYYFGTSYLRAEPLATLEEVASLLRAATPRPPTLDSVELMIAGHHDGQCGRHYLNNPRDVDAAIAECDKARELYQQVIDTTTSQEVRSKATKLIANVRNAEGIRNFVLHLSAIDAGTYQKVIPILQCVKDTGARLEARFSYNNSNPFIVNNPVGRGNLFTPEPQDRGQPTKYLPGLHEGVVTVEVEGKRSDPQRTIGWTLDGTTVSAPLETAPRCKGK